MKLARQKLLDDLSSDEEADKDEEAMIDDVDDEEEKESQSDQNGIMVSINKINIQFIYTQLHSRSHAHNRWWLVLGDHQGTRKTICVIIIIIIILISI